MQAKWAYIGGGSAILAAGVVALQSERWSGPSEGPPVEPPAVVAAAPQPAPAEQPAAAAPAPDGEAELVRLSASLDEERTEAERLRTALAVRDGVMHTLRVSAVKREETLGGLRASLADSEARVAALQQEVGALRAELAALRAPKSFDEAIAALKPESGSSVARLETVSADAGALETMFAAKSQAAPLIVIPARNSPTVEVLFDFASARLTPGAEASALVAATTFADMRLASVRVIGHTDSVGGRAANRRLAVKRARSVADALVAAGLAPELIEIDDSGEAAPPVATGPGVPEPLNRSVAIIPVPHPTS
jgi:outer membrane protein OmpA-like peptidoglycan-associated protein